MLLRALVATLAPSRLLLGGFCAWCSGFAAHTLLSRLVGGQAWWDAAVITVVCAWGASVWLRQR